MDNRFFSALLQILQNKDSIHISELDTGISARQLRRFFDYYIGDNPKTFSNIVRFQLLPNHPSQQPLFQKPFTQQGVYLTIEVENVDEYYHKLKEQGVPISIDLREEPWGDRHFAIIDPNGIGIDIVTYSAPE